jgi:hypothetical protein
MQQLTDAHAQNVAALTADYRAKQLDERKEAENVSSTDQMLPATAEAD